VGGKQGEQAFYAYGIAVCQPAGPQAKAYVWEFPHLSFPINAKKSDLTIYGYSIMVSGLSIL